MDRQTMTRELRVTFQPSGRAVYVLPGTILLEAAARAGFIIETPCGGAGKCGKCLVRVTSGACEPCAEQAAALKAEQLRQGYRLACKCRVQQNLTVEIPEKSLFQASHKILAEDAGGERDLRPAVTKRFLQLAPPDREDPASDAERLSLALDGAGLDIAVLRRLSPVLRQKDFAVTATLIDRTVVALEPGDTTERCFGVAFDIGTTTVVGTLVDLRTGMDVAVASLVNPQTSYGDDVISRIKRCRDEADGLRQLHDAILKAVNAITREVAHKAGVDRHDICEAVFAGNTTMEEILCGIDPLALGQIPFVPAFRNTVSMRAADFGLDVCPGAKVSVFPQIGGFVGGDTVAGVVATRLDQTHEPTLLVDVGTNGEIVLAHKGRLMATSVAAGPAFEGARIVHGMRASKGAIEKVVADGDIELNVIGNARPTGICGTGLIDAAAALLRKGVIDITGRVLGPDELPSDLPQALRSRVVENASGQYDFILVHEKDSGIGGPICLYQKDVRELQLANGAIRAGIAILLRHAGVDPSELGSVLLAGAFGNFIRRNNARRIGMLPQIHTDRIRFVGNTASFGAKRMLLSTREKEYAERIVRETRHIDLSLDPEFQMEFSSAMIFPETE
jgi:uncharacterized 2Fe-2S/4Fe-4S cluster protein (DUF4445 family)